MVITVVTAVVTAVGTGVVAKAHEAGKNKAPIARVFDPRSG